MFKLLTIIIASVLVVSLGGFFFLTRSAQEEHSPDSGNNICQENINMLQEAVDKYKADMGTYPSKISDLVDKYVKEIPKCPGGNGYSIDKDGKVFEDSNYH
ncbi:MAG: hypothetical protein ACOYWZ_04925 [Bacillota bacterium]